MEGEKGGGEGGRDPIFPDFAIPNRPSTTNHQILLSLSWSVK